MKYKKVIYSLFICFAIFALCAPGISKDKIIESKWAAAPVKIDGLNEEWSGDTLILEKKVKVDYAFRNDADNLYVLFIFKEPREYMSTINYTGMTLWLNTEGKKKKHYGIKFQIKTVTADSYISILENMYGPMPEDKKKQIKSKPSYRIIHNEVIDKKGNASLLATGPAAPEFKSGRSKEKTMVYEFRIPLRKGESQAVGIDTELGKTLKIGFEWGGMTEELKQQRLTQQTERGTTGRSGSGTSLTGERRVSSSSASMSSIRRGAKKYSFWADVKLAQNK